MVGSPRCDPPGGQATTFGAVGEAEGAPPRPPRAGNGDGSDAEPSGAPETAMEKIVLRSFE